MKAPEQINNGGKALVDVLIVNSLQSDAELSIRVLSDVGRCELSLVHKLRKAIVTGLLKANLVVE